MNMKSSLSPEWHIPRPSLSGSSSGASTMGDTRSRGGSASSQGSSSNHSTHSACSGSMLLSAAHLAKMNGQPGQDEKLSDPSIRHIRTKRDFSESVVAIPEESHTDNVWSDVKRGASVEKDGASVASSTHFTVVNGFTRQKPSKPKSWCCDHSHQITVLVISMTILFSACILAAICFVEMRMRKETGVYKYS